MYHIPLDVGGGAAYLLPGVEDARGVEDVFRLLKERHHLRAEEHGQIGGTDDAVVVFAGGGAAHTNHELVHFRRQVEHHLAYLGLAEVHERDNVEVAAAHMPRNGVDE